jgi:arsenate reductase (thioredoxin)
MRHCRTAGGNPKRLPGSAVVRCITRRTGVLPPKPLTDDVLRAADIVITMDTSDSLPVYPGKSYEDWAVEDTAGKSLIEV